MGGVATRGPGVNRGGVNGGVGGERRRCGGCVASSVGEWSELKRGARGRREGWLARRGWVGDLGPG